MAKLKRRRPLFTADERSTKLLSPAAKAFHAPQREHPKQPTPTKRVTK